MRGLKPPTVPNINIGNVASFTDAWIETIYRRYPIGSIKVASFTDAWIETGTPIGNFAAQLSHLLQMRGLKHFYWFRVRASIVSHLLQMRGLKHTLKRLTITLKMSHLLQMRGLKLLIIPKNISHLLVASFTDAWIETLLSILSGLIGKVASFTDAWIETCCAF